MHITLYRLNLKGAHGTRFRPGPTTHKGCGSGQRHCVTAQRSIVQFQSHALRLRGEHLTATPCQMPQIEFELREVRGRLGVARVMINCLGEIGVLFAKRRGHLSRRDSFENKLHSLADDLARRERREVVLGLASL